jgi:hypothetical protein
MPQLNRNSISCFHISCCGADPQVCFHAAFSLLELNQYRFHGIATTIILAFRDKRAIFSSAGISADELKDSRHCWWFVKE